MRKRDLVIFTALFLACIAFTSDIVSYQLTGNHLFMAKPKDISSDNRQSQCASEPMPVRQASTDIQLKALSEYEKVCQSAFMNDMMIFTNMPVSVPNAEMYADKMTTRLKEFDNQKVRPIVIVEPDSDWGLVDFQEYADGNYDEWINAYFMRLKQNGITDEMLGLWMPFPEPGQPVWNNSGDPDNFAKSVNRHFTSLRTVFPNARTGILLDSDVSDVSRGSQLLSYTRLLNGKLINVVGLQGFPWHPSDESDKRKPITSAEEFAPASLLQEVADSLDAKEVLFNIGSYRHRKLDNGGDISIQTKERVDTLNSIVHQVNIMTSKNYKVIVNIFAENKFDAKEGVDWSYWKAGEYSKSAQTALFTDFIRKLKDNNAEISIYDARE